MPSNVLPLCLKQTFPPIIWIFTEGEGDEIESRLPFKIFSTLLSLISVLHERLCGGNITDAPNEIDRLTFNGDAQKMILENTNFLSIYYPCPNDDEFSGWGG